MKAISETNKIRSAQRRHQRSDDANAFFPDPEGGPIHIQDSLAEEIAEDFVRGATSGEDQSDRLLDASVSEEIGGPFVETDADEEMADDSDESNPIDAGREPLPRAVAGLVSPEIVASSSDDEDEEEVDTDGGAPFMTRRK